MRMGIRGRGDGVAGMKRSLPFPCLGVVPPNLFLPGTLTPAFSSRSPVAGRVVAKSYRSQRTGIQLSRCLFSVYHPLTGLSMCVMLFSC